MAIFGRSKPSTPDVAEPMVNLRQPTLPDPPEAGESGLRTVTLHRDYLLSLTPSLRPFGVGLLDVSGLTLCESLRSDLDLPVYTAALCDGWAVRASNLVGASEDHPIALPVVGSVELGSLPLAALSPGTTVRVPFGAAVPEGADAVVSADEVREIPGALDLPEGIRFTAEVAYHQGIYPRGTRIGDGDPLLPDGTVVNPRMVSMLAEVGHDKVLARPRPRVVVATIGSDLVDPGLPLTQIHQIYDSSTVMISAAARQDLAQVFPIGILPDDVPALRSILAEQLVRADLVLLVAKSSPQLIEAMSSLGPIDVTDVAMWPNGPRLFGKIGSESTPVLVLPEGAVQSYISYLIFARPLIRQLAGLDPIGQLKLAAATSQRALPVDDSHTQYILAACDGDSVDAIELPADAGGLELARANALITVEPGQQIDAGDSVDCWLLDG